MDEPREPLADELSDLAGLLQTDESLETMLGHVADIAVRAIPACDAAGVTLFEHDRVTTAAASGPLVQRVDNHQYDTDEGPCLESLRTGEIRRSPSLADDTRWPKFRGPTLDEGVVSCLSLPLVIGNHGTGGVLNLYSQNRPFEDADEVIGRRFMPPASVAVANASGAVFSARTISKSFMTLAGEKKCRPSISPGRAVEAAISLTSR